MKKVMCLILLVVFTGIFLHAQERRKGPEQFRRDRERMREKFQDMEMKKGFQNMEMKKEFNEMALKKRTMEFENYISELEFEKEMRELELEKARAALKGGGESRCSSGCSKWKGGKCRAGKMIGDIIFCLMFMLMMVVIHVLLTIWVFIDSRKRDAFSGILIVLTLLTGFVGAFLYALVRIGDSKKK